MKNLNHLAIILDGNRTWARLNNKPEILGHSEGAKNIQNIVKLSLKNNIKVLSLYVLSTENLKNRSQFELQHLFSLFEKLINYKSLFEENKVKLQISGDLSLLPNSVQNSMNTLLKETKTNNAMVLNLCMNYGGRDEIIRAIKKIKTPLEITEETFAKYLDTGNLPEVDLLIRTGGHQRISNFLIWKAAYAELFFSNQNWPDFNENEFNKALEFYNNTDRKFGK